MTRWLIAAAIATALVKFIANYCALKIALGLAVTVCTIPGGLGQ